MTEASPIRPALRLLQPLRPFVLPVLILLAWDRLAGLGGIFTLAFVPLPALLGAFRELWNSGDLVRNVGISLFRVALGLLLGGGAGLVIGAALALSRPLDRIASPVFDGSRQIPTLAWLPLIGLWFGYGEWPKMLLVAHAAMVPILLASYDGFRGLPPGQLEIAGLYRLTPWETFWQIRLPAAAPMILLGTQQALAFAWIACIGVEILFGAGPGIGAMIATGEIMGRMDVVLLGILFVGVIAYALYRLFAWGARHQLRWRQTGERT